MGSDAWSEEDIENAMIAYFELFLKELDGYKPNRDLIFKKLSTNSGRRNYKEFKKLFCNISACLSLQDLNHIIGLNSNENVDPELTKHIDKYLKINPRITKSILGGYLGSHSKLNDRRKKLLKSLKLT